MSFHSIKGDIYLGNVQVENFTELAAGVYRLLQNPETGALFLRQTDNFSLPLKVYGSNTNYSERILEHFIETPNKVSGALLQGVKGTGKSLTAKEICILGAKKGIPTILIEEPFCGALLNNFMSGIQQSAIVFIDEFEKVYQDQERRDKLLSFLDGTVMSHKLVLATVNSVENFDYLINRPGRFYYNISFGNIDKAIIQEYCDDFLIDKSRLPEIINMPESFNIFTIDMLTALVREINKSGEDLNTVLNLINLKPDISLGNCFINIVKLKRLIKGEMVEIELDHYNPAIIYGPSFAHSLQDEDSCNITLRPAFTAGFDPFNATHMSLLEQSSHRLFGIISEHLQNSTEIPAERLLDARPHLEIEIRLSQYREKFEWTIDRDHKIISVKAKTFEAEFKYQLPTQKNIPSLYV